MSVSSMRIEKLHAELFEKMQEEQRVFVEKLKTKAPDEILHQAYVTVLKTIGKDYRRENLISLSGIYLPKKRIEESKVPYPLEQYLLSHPQTEHICLYLDNDFAGKRGAEALEIILGKQYEVRYIPPPVCDD